LLVPTIQKTWAPAGETPILKIAGGWTKISAISAISISSGRTHIGLYLRFHVAKNIRYPQVISFLKIILRHFKKGFVLLWDKSATHKAAAVKRFIGASGRIYAYHFPGYAPELNPDEFVWMNMKRAVANGVPKDTHDLKRSLHRSVRKLKESKALLRSCIRASKLPWG
jgi:transposase